MRRTTAVARHHSLGWRSSIPAAFRCAHLSHTGQRSTYIVHGVSFVILFPSKPFSQWSDDDVPSDFRDRIFTLFAGSLYSLLSSLNRECFACWFTLRAFHSSVSSSG